jgi:hypothetical protein
MGMQTMTERPTLESTGGGMTVVTDAYRLELGADPTRARLYGTDGALWTELCLIASVDTIDSPDEWFTVGERQVTQDPASGSVVIRVAASSTAWRRRETSLICGPEDVRVSVTVEGAGRLSEVSLLGGRAIRRSGATGTFRSSTGFASIFVPTPTEPVDVVRDAAVSAQLSVVGDADPGRLNAIFSPPPLCFGLGRARANAATEIPDGPWLGAAIVAPVEELGFVSLRYDPLDGGFLFRLSYEGHTAVDATWTSPALVLRAADSPVGALENYRDELVRRGWAPPAPQSPLPHWWSEPIFCGWGAQCAEAARSAQEAASSDTGAEAAGAGDGLVLSAGALSAPDLARQDRYDRWLERLAAHGVRPGTIVIDDRWQAAYGTNAVDEDKWPDLRGWIAQRHREGQRVLLWFKAWDCSGLSPDLCIRDASGAPLCVDPSNPEYLELLAEQVGHLLGAEGLDADGFKVDFTQRGPSGAGLLSAGSSSGDGVWGIAALHRLLQAISSAAKRAKPDAMIVTHAIHPSFGAVSDVVRLNDMLERDRLGRPVSVVDQARFRSAVARAVLPGHPVDTDQWPIQNRAEWLAYVAEQGRLGIPALYYLESIDNSGESITSDDLREVAAAWERYRSAAAAPSEQGMQVP